MNALNYEKNCVQTYDFCKNLKMRENIFKSATFFCYCFLLYKEKILKVEVKDEHEAH